MQINISGHHLDLTDALKDYVNNKLERLTHHHDKITTTNVTLTVEKLEQKAEAMLHVSGKDLFADAVDLDMYAAIDQLTDKLDRQLIKHKEKLRSHR
ncbi:ribosome hibernation-promoting factor, HPF/YfiA family [Marinimicrobium sp. C2-29]|uniref:ribosome hibernation-promoting factor, HPF/YfiA family n=1 Tax=Marinimicrobium sp. C2-29 TaxID=3139825 RepID=UPI003138BD68